METWAAAQLGRLAQPKIVGKLPLSRIFIIETNNRITTDGTVENAHLHRAIRTKSPEAGWRLIVLGKEGLNL
jgi:hypothetical protein